MIWNLRGVRGLRSEVKDKISADKELPDHTKAFIQLEIDGLPPECRAVQIDGYAQTHGKDNGATPSNVMRHIQFTVIGIKL